LRADLHVAVHLRMPLGLHVCADGHVHPRCLLRPGRAALLRGVHRRGHRYVPMELRERVRAFLHVLVRRPPGNGAVTVGEYHLVAMGGGSQLPDVGLVFTLSFAIVFGLAGIARWRGWDRDIPILRAIADLAPGVPPLLIAAAALLSIP